MIRKLMIPKGGTFKRSLGVVEHGQRKNVDRGTRSIPGPLPKAGKRLPASAGLAPQSVSSTEEISHD